MTGHGGANLGNVHLKWAFSESVHWMLRRSEDAKAFLKRKEKEHGKSRAMSILSRKIARAVYHMLKRKEPFDALRFFASTTIECGLNIVSSSTDEKIYELVGIKLQ